MEIQKVAVIGCGAVFKVHADAIGKCPYVQLAAVVDVNRQRASEAAVKYNCTFYTEYYEMLSDEKIYSVHICTPHYLHAPLAVEAMKAGKHVLVEKPMAISIKDAEEVIKVSNKTGRKLGICLQNRFNTTALMIKDMIHSGKVGRVLGAKAWLTWYRDARYYKDSGWRGTWKKEGGGVLINQAIHTLDLLQWFIGDVESIKGSVDNRLLKGVIEVEDTAEATIKFKNGATALFYASNCYTINSPVEIEIVCEKAVIRLGEDLTVKYQQGNMESLADVEMRQGEKSYWGLGHEKLICDFYQSLIQGREFCIEGQQGIKSLKLVKAIYQSAETGSFIQI